jgi:hypothetical protein
MPFGGQRLAQQTARDAAAPSQSDAFGFHVLNVAHMCCSQSERRVRSPMTKPIGVLGILANALIATACNGQDGQATFDYLKAEVHIVEQGKRNLEVRHLPKPPTPPVFTKQTKPKDRLTQKKEYRESLALYYTNVIQVTTESEKLLNHVQNQRAP